MKLLRLEIDGQAGIVQGPFLADPDDPATMAYLSPERKRELTENAAKIVAPVASISAGHAAGSGGPA